MNWGAFDLNLLIVFDAVMQERNVTRAGQKIGLSQPAMSHALNRLRYMLKDQLFIRTPEGMVPTARAEQLAGPLRRAANGSRIGARTPRGIVGRKSEASSAALWGEPKWRNALRSSAPQGSRLGRVSDGNRGCRLSQG